MSNRFSIVRLAAATVAIAVMALSFSGLAKEKKAPNPVVVIETSLGNITAELFQDKSPKTVENFLSYVNEGFYRGTIFHRVISGFMIQGGGFTVAMEHKPTRPPVVNESSNGLHNARGTLAMARTPDPNSATSQFFINTKDNPSLDRPQEPNGYAVFGKVIEGMSVVDKIEAVATTTKGSYANVPVKPVVIKNISLKTPAAK